MRLRRTMCSIRPGVNSLAEEKRRANTSRDTNAASYNTGFNVSIY